LSRGPSCSRLVLLFWAAVLLSAQAGHITPFTGVWKLNLAESKFDPGPPFQSFTLTFTPDGTRHLDLIGADGAPLQASLPWSDGKEVAVAVTQGDLHNVTAISKIHGKTFDDTWRENGKTIEKVHGAIRKVHNLAITVEGTDRQGRAYHNRLIFEKQ